jgi:hypothetical protein
MPTGADLYFEARRRLQLPRELSAETIARIAGLVDGRDVVRGAPKERDAA